MIQSESDLDNFFKAGLTQMTQTPVDPDDLTWFQR